MDLDSFRDTSWDLIDINCFLNDDDPDPFLNNHHPSQSIGVGLDVSLSGATSQEKESAEIEGPRKRGRNDPCSKNESKASRERQRREKLNERFSELCSVLEPGRPAKTDKLAILGDAIWALNQLKSESHEYKEKNDKLMEEIKTLKEDKNELREEKMRLKAEKEKLEQQVKGMNVPVTIPVPVPGPGPGFMQGYQGGGVNKMTMFPGYGMVPMWQYLPPSARDTSRDRELRPPAA